MAKANIALVVTNEVPPTIPLVAGFKAKSPPTVRKCRIVQEVNVGVTEWGMKIQPAVQSTLRAQSGNQCRRSDL